MTALLLLAHGSPRVEANDDVHAVAAVLRERGVFDIIEVGFLDVNQPDIPAAIAQIVARGGREIVAVPYFLHTGKHVVRDLPQLLEEAMQRHPELVITMGDYVGHDAAIDEVLIARRREAGET